MLTDRSPRWPSAEPPADRAAAVGQLAWEHTNDPALQRWRAGLVNLTGLTPAEADTRLDVLLTFCQAQGCAPHELVAACREGPERLERRAAYLALARATPANLVVQSFLVHNGVNVFGEIVCMPATPAQLRAEQGAHWAGAGAAPTEHDHD